MFLAKCTLGGTINLFFLLPHCTANRIKENSTQYNPSYLTSLNR
jgi:hypothetical protein